MWPGGYEQIEMGEKKLKQMMDLELGEIRIGASDMTLRFYLLPYLERFHELCPGIKVMVTNAPTPETLVFLKSGKIDFGVVSTPFSGEGVHSETVREIEDIFVAGRQFFQYKNKTLDLHDLETCLSSPWRRIPAQEAAWILFWPKTACASIRNLNWRPAI